MHGFSFLFALSLVFFPVLSSLAVMPQDTVQAVTVWRPNMTGSLNVTQTGYHNWKEGGINTFAFSAGIDGKSIGTSDRWKQTHDWRFTFGQIKQDTLGFRKSEDLIRYGFSLQYQESGRLNPTAAFDLRTQFVEGYNYDRNPFRDGRPPPVLVSDFFAPATITQSLGLTYDHDFFKTRLGVAARETVVIVPELRSLYRVDLDRNMRFELGIESRTEFEKEVFENVTLRSRLGLFAAFNRADLPDALWENFVDMRVNTWLGVKFEFVTYYKRELSPMPQFKEVLSVGLSYQFLK